MADDKGTAGNGLVTDAAKTAATAAHRTRAEIEREAYESAKLNQVGTYAELPASGKLRLRFANGSEFLRGVTPVERSHLKAAVTGRVTYEKEVDFPPEGDPIRVSEAWLLAANGDAVCCAFVGVLPAGGGHHAKIPAGNLLF